MLVATNIAEERVGEIHVQQPATVTVTAFPNDVLEGEVVKIKPVNDPKTRTFLVYTKLANPALKLTARANGVYANQARASDLSSAKRRSDQSDRRTGKRRLCPGKWHHRQAQKSAGRGGRPQA